MATTSQVAEEKSKLFAASMKRENEELLKLLNGGVEDDWMANFEESTPKVDFEAKVSKDLEMDPFGDWTSGNRNSNVTYTPQPALQTNNRVRVEAVANVPVQTVRLADPASTATPVVAQKGTADASFSNFNTIIRSANSNARGAGNKVSSVVVALGEDGSSVVQADIHAWLFRICQALFAAEQGASAALLPVLGEDLVLLHTPLANLGTAIENYPDAVPVYLPRELSQASKAAAMALLVQGGAAAYTWRYRGGQLGRQDIMPAVMRWAAPGGYNQLLAVTDHEPLPPVGGHALTIAALRGLETFYRRRYGNDLMDCAWRTVNALAHVYVAPIQQAAHPLHPAGLNMRHYTVTQTTRAPEPVIDLGGFEDNVPQTMHPEALTNNGRGLTPYEAIDRIRSQAVYDQIIKDMFTEAWLQGLVGGAFQGMTLDTIRDVRVNPADVVFTVRWHNPNVQPLAIVANEVIVVPWNILMMCVGVVPPRSMAMVRAMSAMLRGILEMSFMLPPGLEDDQGPAVEETTCIRNVYGANDYVSVHLPYLNINAVVGVVSHFLKATQIHSKQMVYDANNRRAWGRLYAARLHLANFFEMAKKGLCPVDLSMVTVPHAAILKNVNHHLQSSFVMKELDRLAYDTQNWHVIESPYMLRGVSKSTPFVGHVVPGEWEVNASGRVEASKKENSFAAMEAAIRWSHDVGASVDALAQFAPNTHFAIIRGRNGLVNPMPFAHRIAGTRAYETVVLSPVGMQSPLLQGKNTSMAFSVYR